jgi:hypothetical protein
VIQEFIFFLVLNVVWIMAIVHLCHKENSAVLWSYAYVNENFQLGDVFSWNCIIFNGFFLMFLLHTWRITACLVAKSFFL